MRVQVPPPAPRRSKLYIACSDFFTKVRARSCRCSSFPNCNRSAGLQFGFGCSTGNDSIYTVSMLQLRNSHHRSVSALRRKLHSGGNFFALGPDSLRWIPGRERRGYELWPASFLSTLDSSSQASYRLRRVFYASHQKLISRSFCCSSLPNRTRCAGLRFGSRC